MSDPATNQTTASGRLTALTPATRVEQIGNATLYCGDCRDVLPHLGPLDAVVTSPPYAQQRDYGRKIRDWDEIMRPLCHTPSADDCQILVNLGLIYRDGELWEYWRSFLDRMRSSGWRLFGQYVWDKGYGLPGEWHGRLAPSHEFVFHLNRRPRNISKWVPTQGRSSLKRAGGRRDPNGTVRINNSAHTVGQPFKVPDSVIRIGPHNGRGGLEDGHPAVYPVAFAEHLCRTFSARGHTVLDPFMGSGTTGVACAHLGRTFIGIEIEPAYFDIACHRIAEAQRQPDLFVGPMPDLDAAYQRTLFEDAVSK